MFKPGSIYRVRVSSVLGEKNSVILVTSCENVTTKFPSTDERRQTVVSFLEKKEDALLFEKSIAYLSLIESHEDLEFWMQALEPLVTSLEDLDGWMQILTPLVAP